jgi:hypothetical protein
MRVGHRIIACSVLTVTSVLIGAGVTSLQAGAATTHHQHSVKVKVQPKDICVEDGGQLVCGGINPSDAGMDSQADDWWSNVELAILENWGKL